MAETWLDTRTGDLLVGRAAIAVALEQSGPGDIEPLSQILIEETPIDNSGFDIGRKPRHRQPDEVKVYCQWIANVLRQDDNFDNVLKPSHFERMSPLRLGPTYGYLRKQLGGMLIEDIAAEVGLPRFSSPHTFDDWSLNDYVANAAKLAAHLGRKPKEEDYADWARKGRGPGPSTIAKNFPGDTGQLNDAIGYPDINKWAEEDYIDWGVRYMRANGGQLPTILAADILSKRKRGPSARVIYFKFGDIKKYQHAVRVAYEADVWDETDNSRFAEEEFNQIVKNSGESPKVKENERPPVIARYWLIRECLPEDDKATASQMALASNSKNLVSTIRKRAPHLTAGHIEMIAVTHDTFDIIWPQHNADRHLVITEEEMTEARHRASAKRMKNKAKQLARPGLATPKAS